MMKGLRLVGVRGFEPPAPTSRMKKPQVRRTYVEPPVTHLKCKGYAHSRFFKLMTKGPCTRTTTLRTYLRTYYSLPLELPSWLRNFDATIMLTIDSLRLLLRLIRSRVAHQSQQPNCPVERLDLQIIQLPPCCHIQPPR